MSVDMELELEHLLARTAILETLRRYCASLDRRDFEALASCFSDDCRAKFSVSSTETDTLVGGKAIAKWCHAILQFRHSIHNVSHADIKIDGEMATSTSLLVATLIHGSERGGRAFVRGIQYDDTLRRTGNGTWLIDSRSHRALWQYDAPSQIPGLPDAN
jgi:ketosteroid isomerase-like protein